MPRVLHLSLLAQLAQDRQEAGLPGDAEPVETEAAPATLDAEDHLGVLPNWEPQYGFEEQVMRFNSTTAQNVALMYALNPSSSAEALFDRKWIEAAKDRTVTLDAIARRLLPPGRVIIGCDPAFSAGPRSSWFVAVAISFIPQTKTSPERRIVLALKRYRGLPSIEAQGSILQELHHDYRAEAIGVESNAAQQYLAGYCEHTLHLPVKRLFTGERDADAVPALAQEFAGGRWTIPFGDARTQREFSPLINELCECPEGTTDCLMALTFARKIYYAAPAKKTGSGANIVGIQW